MKVLLASIFALSLLGGTLGATAADADVGVHVGGVGIHVGGGDHDRGYRGHDRHYRHYRHRRCERWGYRHHSRYCHRWGWGW